MKASDFGGRVPSGVGDIAYGFSEDDMWGRTKHSEDDAVGELITHLQLNGALPNPGEHLGYIGMLVESEVPVPNVGEMIREIVSGMEEIHSPLPDNFLPDTGADVEELEDEITQVFGKWMTKHGKWLTFAALEDVRPVMMPELKGGGT